MTYEHKIGQKQPDMPSEDYIRTGEDRKIYPFLSQKCDKAMARKRGLRDCEPEPFNPKCDVCHCCIFQMANGTFVHYPYNTSDYVKAAYKSEKENYCEEVLDEQK